MKKVIVLREFDYHGTSYKEGDEVELIDHVADKFCNRHLARKYEERQEESEPRPKKKERRKRKRKE